MGRRDPILTWFFAMVIVRKGDKFLLVHERKHGQLWYIPGGRVEPGETIEEGAIRETLEEGGIAVKLEGLLRVEHSPMPDGSARCRVFFLARPIDDTPPKSIPDDESLEARWVHPKELSRYALRSEEVVEVINYVAGGGPVFPMMAFTYEGAPWIR
ncbi:MAG TPA: NUDIX hydrolase [Polyangium sp.]|nr:NUDIX hydrolase [Polyangium sp.]